MPARGGTACSKPCHCVQPDLSALPNMTHLSWQAPPAKHPCNAPLVPGVLLCMKLNTVWLQLRSPQAATAFPWWYLQRVHIRGLGL